MASESAKHVVIVGGGMAGIYTARELLLKSTNNITLLEASDYFGGRIRGNTTLIPNHVVDIGAEYIHGKETLLTDLIEEYTANEKWATEKKKVTYEAFITAHGDGGPHPSCGYTEDGHYGRYYMDNELMEGNDKRLEPLHTVLASLDDCEAECDRTQVSIGQVLEQRLPFNENQSLHDMAMAGYANTIGCTSLDKVSLHMLNKFEEHWQENEVEGDLHMDSTIGMYGIVQTLVDELQSKHGFDAKLNWQVTDIHQQECGRVKITSANDGDDLFADAVVVTVPPPMLTKLGLDLNEKKLQALQYIGFDTAVKVIVKFSSRLWPSHLQSVICASCIIPEIWFHNYDHDDNSTDSCCTATGFLMSDYARDFIKLVSDDNDGEPCLETAASLVMDQLSQVLDVPRDDLQQAYMDSILFDWSTHPFIQGGYMYPKVGMTPQHLEDLAEPQGSVFFGGEATNTNASCTIQAAMETGVRAAKQVQEYLLGKSS